MAFTDTQSVVAADLNNMKRGLYRDNTNHAVTGTTAETDMASVSITGGTIGATGGLFILAAGTCTNVGGGTKDINLYLGSTLIDSVSRTGSNAQDWTITAWLFNTAADAQRWFTVHSAADSTATLTDYATSAVDTASNATLKITGDLSNSTDTITQTIFDVFQFQIP
jgi:hypothetical protein